MFKLITEKIHRFFNSFNSTKINCCLIDTVKDTNCIKSCPFTHLANTCVKKDDRLNRAEYCLLSNLDSGELASVTAVSAINRDLRCKLFALGIASGSEVAVKQRTPLSNALTVDVLHTMFAIRSDEARFITVTKPH